MQKTGATWIATTDYRTYAMLRWYFNGRVPVIQINERGRFQGFRDPGMNLIRDHAGLYVAREPDNRLPLWDLTTAKRQPLERVERSWRGMVMDTYALEKLTGWTPELSPPPDSPLFRWRVLAGVVRFGSGCFVVQSSLSSPSSFRDAPLGAGPESISPSAISPRWISRRANCTSWVRATRAPEMTAGYDFAFSRRVAPEICIDLCSLSKAEGAGKTGCTLHPRSRVQLRTENAHTSIQVQRKHSGLPCAMALRLISCSPR